MIIKFQETKLSDVLQYFKEGFKLKKGQKILSYEAFVDTALGTVIFKLYLNKE